MQNKIFFNQSYNFACHCISNVIFILLSFKLLVEETNFLYTHRTFAFSKILLFTQGLIIFSTSKEIYNQFLKKKTLRATKCFNFIYSESVNFAH